MGIVINFNLYNHLLLVVSIWDDAILGNRDYDDRRYDLIIFLFKLFLNKHGLIEQLKCD